MSRYLVNFGDSWAHGSDTAEYPVRNAKLHYAYQLAQLCNRSLIDVSQSGTGVAHMILQFQQFVQQHYQPGHDYLAVFFITAKERQLMFDSAGAAQELHPQHDHGASLGYYRDIYTDQLGEFNLNTTLIALQALARHYHCDDRYILGWQQPKLWAQVDCARFYNQAESTVMSLLGNNNINDCGHNSNPNFIPNDGHPSAAGHTHIAETLYQWISN
jgi:hypothetical protein